MNKTASIIILVILVVLGIYIGYSFAIKTTQNNQQQKQQIASTTQPTSSQQKAEITQLTKDAVLNGYNQCGQQFKNGRLEAFSSYEEYNKWLSERKAAKEAECPFIMNLRDKIILSDLDNDGLLEAVVLADSCSHDFDCYPPTSYSSGLRLDDVSLIVFKNINGVATISDEHYLCNNGNGECNEGLNSVNKNNILVDFGGAHMLPPSRTIYEFINNRINFYKESPLNTNPRWFGY